MNPIEVRTGKAYWRRIGLLWGMFGFFGLVMTAMARAPLLGIVGLVMMIAPAWLLYQRRVLWVLRMDREGVTLRSGKRMPWGDLQQVVDVTAVRGGARWHNHYELVFRNGRARVFDRMLANADEVVRALGPLAHGQNPFTGGALAQ
jgi:hypothetical protein